MGALASKTRDGGLILPPVNNLALFPTSNKIITYTPGMDQPCTQN